MSQTQRTYLSSRKFGQQTLLSFLGSSPSSSSSSSEEFTKSPSPRPSKRKRNNPSRRKQRHRIYTSSSSHSDAAQDPDSDVGAIRFEPEIIEISDEDHPPCRPKKRKKSIVGAHAIPIRTISDESLEETIGVPRYRKGKNKAVLDSEDEAQPRKRKLIKGIRPPTPEEDNDILEEGNQVLKSRLRSRGKMTTYQKSLEKFKSKKRGEPVLESLKAEESECSAGAPFKGSKPHRNEDSDASHGETNSDEEDEDFIVDDDAHGIPAAQLPLAFSLSAHQDLTHHFKIVCQLFVHIAVQPLADRHPFLERALREEEYLSVPLQVTRRKLSGMRDSLVASSVWRSDFKKALETYPKFNLVQLKFAIPQCDACHLGGRLSTLLGRLRGKSYDKYDFEDISDESGESSEGDEDEDEVNGKRDIRKVFHLGRFCAARTRVYHQFSHWEYSLYKSLQREIMEVQDGTRRFVKVAYVGGRRPPRDLHDADRIMEWLDERGIIEMEWQKVRQMMESARNLEREGVDL